MTVYGGVDMDVVKWVSPPYAMTTERCTDFCAQKGFAYAALQANYLCFCLYQEQVCDAARTRELDSSVQTRTGISFGWWRCVMRGDDISLPTRFLWGSLWYLTVSQSEACA